MKLVIFIIVSFFCGTLCSVYSLADLHNKFPFCETIKIVENSNSVDPKTRTVIPQNLRTKKIACSVKGYELQPNGSFKNHSSFTFTMYISPESETTNGIGNDNYSGNPMLENFIKVSRLVDLQKYKLCVFLEEDQEVHGIRAISNDGSHPNFVWLIYGTWENIPRRKLIPEREFLAMI